uniref:Acyl CoA binding protein ACBP n=1 Tax=Pseudomonas phage RVTF4 TaxID=3236931 RepID=A0AB39CC89_9VIRU
MNEILLGVGEYKTPPIELRNWVIQSTGSTQVSLQAGSITHNDEFFIFGGRQGLSGSGRSTAYRFNKTSLVALRALPTTLILPSVASDGNLIYIVGGCFNLVNGQESRKVYTYDPALDVYEELVTMPFASLGGCSDILDGYLYVYGGLVNQVEENLPRQFYRLNLTTKTWEQLTYHDATMGVHSSGSWIQDGKLYYYGGENYYAGGRDQDIREYDPVAAKWTKLPRPSVAPAGRSVVMRRYTDDSLYLMGGRIADGQVVADCWLYTISTNTWTKCKNFLAGIAFQSLLVNGDDIYCVEGYGGGGLAHSGIYRLQQ